MNIESLWTIVSRDLESGDEYIGGVTFATHEAALEFLQIFHERFGWPDDIAKYVVRFNRAND
jgi:hypothetical protein